MANKLTTYLVVMSGLVLLFYFTGLLQTCSADGLCESQTPNSSLLDALLDPQGMNTGNFAAQVAILLVALTVAAVIIGFFNQQSELIARSAFATYMLGILWDFLYVVGKVWSVNPVLAILFFSPLLLLYMVTIVDWVSKND